MLQEFQLYFELLKACRPTLSPLLQLVSLMSLYYIQQSTYGFTQGLRTLKIPQEAVDNAGTQILCKGSSIGNVYFTDCENMQFHSTTFEV